MNIEFIIIASKMAKYIKEVKRLINKCLTELCDEMLCLNYGDKRKRQVEVLTVNIASKDDFSARSVRYEE